MCITGKSIYLNDTAELNADTNNEYELYVECTDGTDTTQAFLRVEITKDQIDNEEPVEWIQYESYTMAAVGVVSLTISTFTIYTVIHNGLSAYIGL